MRARLWLFPFFGFMLLLVGCQAVRVAPGPAPVPVGFEPRVVVHVSGAGDFQSFIGAVPFSAFLRWQGNGTIEARLEATGVTIYADGDSTWVVTPVAGLEAEAEAAVEMGRIVIRRNGQPAGLAHPVVPPAPATVPPAPKPSEPVASTDEGPCDDGACKYQFTK